MRLFIAAAAIGAIAATPLTARNAKLDRVPPAAIKALAACKPIADPGQRLSCYDAAAGDIGSAIASGDLYVVDKAEIRKTRRTLFGLPLPGLGLFGDDADDANVVREIDGVVSSATAGFDGNWTIELEGGSIWHQTDGYPLSRSPRKGSKVKVMRAALGSYKMSVEGGSAVRVKRIR